MAVPRVEEEEPFIAFHNLLRVVIGNLPPPAQRKLMDKLHVDHAKDVITSLLILERTQMCALLNDTLTLNELRTSIKATPFTASKGSICSHITAMATVEEHFSLVDPNTKAYITNLQQQVYFLELELNLLKRSGEWKHVGVLDTTPPTAATKKNKEAQYGHRRFYSR
jgi:hypothetical protein